MADHSLFLPLTLLAACIAGTASLMVTRWVRDYFHHHDYVDRPNEARKQQKQAIPYGGGTSVMICGALALSIAEFVTWCWSEGTTDFGGILGLVVAAVLMWAVGLYDDLRNMRGATKLFWQMVAAGIVAAPGTGMYVHRVAMFGWDLPLGYWGIPLTIVWILAAINSLNLLDGMDGLAGTVGLLFSVTIGLMAMSTDRWMEAMVAFALAGSLLGFLRFNWPPAQIYLGDSGSMLIGLVLGTLAIRCEVKDAASVAVAAPLAMFAIPLIDSAAAIVRRKFTGRSMYTTDRGHIHHRLQTMGLTNKQTLYLLGGLCSITCLGGFLDVYFRSVPIPFGMIAVVLVVLIMLTTRLFGNSELSLLGTRMAGVGSRILPAATPRNSSVRLQGKLEWESVWQHLLESTERFGLIHLRLNLHLPDLHEDFYATWRVRTRSRTDGRWTVELPLVVEGRTIGTLIAVGVRLESTVAPSLLDFSDLVAQLERELGQIVELERQRLAGSTAAGREQTLSTSV